jgi:predicted adenylyl cyclase CyaB
MPMNIEIKARVDDLPALTMKVAALADAGPFEILQDDTFFPCTTGRLKLRVFSDVAGELIFYRREDREGPKESSYTVSPTSCPGSLREALELAYGVAGRIVKRRTLYLVGRTRVHLDEVAGLGSFLELEVVLEDGESSQAGVHDAHDLMATLGVAPDQLVATAYVDLACANGDLGA